MRRASVRSRRGCSLRRRCGCAASMHFPRGSPRWPPPRPRQPAARRRRAAIRGVRTPDAQAQLEAIAAWCRERLAAQPDARLPVGLPGAGGALQRLAQLIRGALDPLAALAGSADSRALVGVEGGEPFGSLALPGQALLSLTLLAGGEIDPDSLSRWL